MLHVLVKHNFCSILSNKCAQSWQIWQNEIQDEKLDYLKIIDNPPQIYVEMFTASGPHHPTPPPPI